MWALKLSGKSEFSGICPTAHELRNGMNSKPKAATVSHEELQEAIRKFQKNGGMIQKLPDQVTLGHHAVGSALGTVDSSTKPDSTVES
jgi:hypothetical protein